ncbi:MAG TPA: hypothetical protein VF789_18200 [Thermoanaerobaculia bacterium]
MRSTRLWLLVLAVALLPLSLGAQPNRLVIPPGSDCWHTEAGTEQLLESLPKDFFGPGSKAIPKTKIQLVGVPLPVTVVTGKFPPNCECPLEGNVNTMITWLDPHGNKTNDTRHAVKQVVTQTTTVDTCIRRTVKADFPGQGAAVQVNIQLVALSLKSVTPLPVSFTDGKNKKFDIFVTQSAKQDPGTMTLTAGKIQAGKTKGKTRLKNLHITYDVEFREVVPAGTRPIVKKLLNQKLVLEGTTGTFTFSGVKL